ncbi:hypothetical protein GSI_02027 [Ganoderma sinense ZZ0214-1]|uniref:chitinase n=1 Tax=Ganoderma sinense ZZ0214-1 TaxID=1077348 RepID=A0A2G8SNG6_9APHY|nr:hypothetical protein GSI_02027 [Ganoderma sinense ZZ0214-1]
MNPRLRTAFPFYGALCALLFVVAAQAAQFDMAQSNNVAIEPDLMDVCQSDASDTVILAFVSAYPTSTGSMEYGFGACNQDDLDECAQLQDAVKACHAAGKILTISIGGGDGSVVLSSDNDAEKFGEMVYDTFLGGKGRNRPFGDVVLDGVDLDIEGGGTTHFPAFVNHNNEPTCGLEVAQRGWDNFNFATWDDWAANTSPNKNIRLYIGSPASQAAGSYYVDAAQMGTIIAATRQNYSSFGGVMLWDAGNARDEELSHGGRGRSAPFHLGCQRKHTDLYLVQSLIEPFDDLKRRRRKANKCV